MNSRETETPVGPCSCSRSTLLQIIVAELLRKNQLLRNQLQEAQSRLARFEAVSPGIERKGADSRGWHEPGFIFEPPAPFIG
jgi:hypothetical protein